MARRGGSSQLAACRLGLGELHSRGGGEDAEQPAVRSSLAPRTPQRPISAGRFHPPGQKGVVAWEELPALWYLEQPVLGCPEPLFGVVDVQVGGAWDIDGHGCDSPPQLWPGGQFSQGDTGRSGKEPSERPIFERSIGVGLGQEQPPAPLAQEVTP